MDINFLSRGSGHSSVIPAFGMWTESFRKSKKFLPISTIIRWKHLTSILRKAFFERSSIILWLQVSRLLNAFRPEVVLAGRSYRNYPGQQVMSRRSHLVLILSHMKPQLVLILTMAVDSSLHPRTQTTSEGCGRLIKTSYKNARKKMEEHLLPVDRIYSFFH